MTVDPPVFQPRSSFISVMYSYSSDNIQGLYVYLYGQDLDWCRAESCSPLMPSVQTRVCPALSTASSKISTNPAILSSLNIWIQFHQHFHRDPADLSTALWKKRGRLHFTDMFMDDMFICFRILLLSEHQQRNDFSLNQNRNHSILYGDGAGTVIDISALYTPLLSFIKKSHSGLHICIQSRFS